MSGTNGNPGLEKGDIPTHTEWNSFWTVKVDALNGFATNLRLTGSTTATLPLDDNTEALATTEFVQGALSTSGGYVLPVATPTALGGVMPDGVTLANNSGVLSVRYGNAHDTAMVGDDARVTGALSSATAAATYAPLNSPHLVGAPTAPTPPTLDDDTSIATSEFVWNALATGLRGHLTGMRLSNDVTTPNTVLDIDAGIANDSTNTTLISLGPFTKSVSGAWVAGAGNAGLGTGLTLTISTWYHVFAIINAGVADVYFDTSVVAANAPAGTTAFRRIGSIRYTAAAQIRAFNQTGDRFDVGAPLLEYNATPGSTAASNLTMNDTPFGIVTQAILSGIITDPTGTNSVLYLSSLAQADVAPSVSAAVTAVTGATVNTSAAFNITVVTNTSGQIRRRVSSTTALVNVLISGWIDNRGRTG